MLWLAKRCVCMRVCKHGCDVNMFCFSHANHTSTNLKKILSWKTQQVYFIYPFPHWPNLGKSLADLTLCQFFFASADILKTLILESIFFAKQGLITRTSFMYKTSQLLRISLLINALNKRVWLFFLEKLFHKSNRKLFFCVCISWYKHSRSLENSRQLCKPSTLSQVCITVSNSPNPSCVCIRLCKHRKPFLLLKFITLICVLYSWKKKSSNFWYLHKWINVAVPLDNKTYGVNGGTPLCDQHDGRLP